MFNMFWTYGLRYNITLLQSPIYVYTDLVRGLVMVCN